MNCRAVAFLWLASTAAAAPKDPWEPFRFLAGEWIGEGTGQPGAGSGGSTFRFELDDKVLTRENRADYPATKDRPAFSHRDRMIVYPEEGALHAIYFDNEGHVIHYAVSASGDGKRIVFVSPQYRMTYEREGDAVMKMKFEIAPPGKPEGFVTYIDARLRKK